MYPNHVLKSTCFTKQKSIRISQLYANSSSGSSLLYAYTATAMSLMVIAGCLVCFFIYTCRLCLFNISKGSFIFWRVSNKLTHSGTHVKCIFHSSHTHFLLQKRMLICKSHELSPFMKPLVGFTSSSHD